MMMKMTRRMSTMIKVDDDDYEVDGDENEDNDDDKMMKMTP